MKFRKDEYVLQEEPDQILYEDCDEIAQKKLQQNQIGPEQAYELIEKAEFKISNIVKTLNGIDKRMSYNSRLIGAVLVAPKPDQNKDFINIEDQQEPDKIKENVFEDDI